MRRWEEHWFGPVAAIRPYLFQKCFTLMLAFDLLVLMVERGARYSADRIVFNVAHFPLLDTLHSWMLPRGVPGEIYYVCVLTLTSFLSFCLFFGGHRPWLMALVCGLFTYGWSMSRLDSYLHHYMLSLILFCMIFFPPIDARAIRSWWRERGASKSSKSKQSKSNESGNSNHWVGNVLGASLIGLAVLYRVSLSQAVGLSEEQRWTAMCAAFAVLVGLVWWASRSVLDATGPRASAWSFRLLLTTVGVIYVFAAVAKMDAEWCGGHTLKSVGATEIVLQPLVRIAESLGLSPDVFWAVLATAVIPLELTLAGIYVVSVWQDGGGQDGPRRWLRRACLYGWLLAVGLHLNNEMMNLVIQWFGYYMLLLATILLLPAPFLLVAGSALIEPECWLRERYEKLLATRLDSLVLMAALTLSAIVALVVFAFLTQIPGMVVAAGLLVFGLIIAVAIGVVMAWNKSVFWATTTATISAIGMTCAVAQSTVQFDYHAIRGLTLMNVGRVAEAAQHYEEARLYHAPSKKMAAEANTNLAISYVKLAALSQASTTQEEQLSSPKRIERLFREAIDEDPFQFVAYYSFGNFLVTRNRLAEAEQYFLGAIAIKSDFSDAYYNLGSLYERSGRLQEAIDCYERAAKIEPNARDVQQALTGARAKLSE